MQCHNRCDIKRLKNDTLYFETDYLKPLPEGTVLHPAPMPIDILL